MQLISLELRFPNLRGTGYRVESPRTDEYNCVAWAVGVSDCPWWPIYRNPYYWPEEPRVESLSAFIRVFQGLGYEICENGNLETGFEKIAIYVDEDETPSHVARQLASGEWTSKCGDWEDIIHNTLDGLEGAYPAYGKVASIMKKTVRGEN